ncbi:type II toxin-antitoxin system HicA family toxin [Alicyclobacillaceae bacterium I2511]|nr:type II toxin-antitoxin system HicA family toxin [Alicyclobacillaceae bacterium I2511]
MIDELEKDGWYLSSQKGSHKHFRHPEKKGKVQVPDHGNVTLKSKTAKSILKQAGIN